MAYVDDKRIYELQDAINSVLNMYLPLDALGEVEAVRLTVQDLINIISPNVATQNWLDAVTSNPDNATGNDGDFVAKVLAGGVTIYQKVSGSWSPRVVINTDNSIEVTGTTGAGSNTFNCSAYAIGVSPTYRVYATTTTVNYNAGDTIPADYNYVTKILSGIAESTPFTARFI